MEVVRSAGAALYTVQDGETRWVLVREKSGSVGLPKGHVEKGETPEQAALREIREETGLQAELCAGEPLVDAYPLADGRLKRVTYYLARYEDQALNPDPTQVEEAMLLPLKEALAALSHGSARRILRRAARAAERQGV
ncbi:MAG: NUDIX domain-containing protein [Eubacteriales bacterium]|nr:NUDIX domain-containing protein [Eubacteriales bacterium]